MTRNIRFLVFRHGETDWNKAKRFQGHSDIPLNATGEEQARSLIKKVNRFAADLFLTSDLVRAQQTIWIATAELRREVAGLGPEAQNWVVTSGLREGNLGVAEGRYRDDLMREFPSEHWQAWGSVDPEHRDFGFPGGETKRQIVQRVQSCLEHVVQLERFQNVSRVLVSTHGGVIRNLVHACDQAPPDPVPIPNCCSYELTLSQPEGHWRFVG